VRRLPVEDLVPRARPLELGRVARPERFGIAVGLLVDALVADVRVRAEPGGRGERAIFAEEIGEFGVLAIGHAADSTYPAPNAVNRARTWTARSAWATAPYRRNAR